MNKSLLLDLRLRKIQEVRLAQAIMESRFNVHLREDPHGQFAHLSEYFTFVYTVGGEAPALPGLAVDHATPLTRIGSLARPLIFPHAAFERCRTYWTDLHAFQFFFAGHITPERRDVLRKWSRQMGCDVRVPRAPGKLARWFGSRGKPVITTSADSQLTFWSSERGREFPVKAWDDSYFRALARARFAVCPSGDFVWTYRFFEAAMCGAIPIIEAPCPAYEGFQYFTFQHSGAELRWSREVAEHNYNFCLRRLTIPRPELDAELEGLLRS